MSRVALLLLSLLVPACRFDRAGLPLDDRGAAPLDFDGAGDQTPPVDGWRSDREVDLGPPDSEPMDLAAPDMAVVVPIDASTLGQAYITTQVPCVDMQGNSDGTLIPIADDANVLFFDGTATLANASSALKTWAGAGPTATVMWNPNACDDEWPLSSGDTWTQAGLLIRGASLNGSGQLVLEPGLTIADLDVLDILADAGFEQEVFEPDDSGLTGHPPLVAPVTTAKQLILQLGYK